MKKLLTRTLAMVMTLVMLLSMAVFTTSAEEILPSEDFEEENGVFHIENASDMLAFAGMAEFYQYYADKTVSIDANIDMTGASWTMIANFKGILEGNGHCIKNLDVTSTGGSLSIFSVLSGATIRNIRFLDCDIKGGAQIVAGIAAKVVGATTFENVYVDSTIEATNAIRPGGFIGLTQASASVTFKNCVSASTIIGSGYGGGFIAIHTNAGASAEFIDCAFIGDMSQVGTRSSNFIGITDANTKFTRCISFGQSSEDAKSGDFVTLNRQGGQGTNKSKHEFIDCYGITPNDTQTAVVLDNPTGMDISITYGGAVLFNAECADSATALTDDEKTTFESRFKYLIKGTTSNFDKTTFKTMYPVFTDWTVTDVEVEYAEGKTITAVLPTSIVTLLAGSTDVPTAGGQTPDGGDEQTPDGGDEQTPGANNNTETQAPETTDTEAATTAAQTEATEDKGCGGVIGVGAVVVMAVAGAAVVATRKKED